MKKTLAFAAAMAVVAISAQAAVVAWDVPVKLSGDGATDVSSEGSPVDALDAQGGAITVGGVSFRAMDYNGPVIVGGGAGYGDFQIEATNTNPNITDAAYYTLLDSGIYNETGIRFQGLTIGQQYLIQIWTCDSRYLGGTRTATYDDGNGNTVDVDHGIDGNLGQYVIGRFTADAALQDITPTGDLLVNAAQLRSIPEPATLGLLGLVGGAVVFARRRFMI